MCSYQTGSADTQDLRRTEDEHREVRATLKQRQQHGAAMTYRVLAGVTGGLALLLWGFLIANSAHRPGAPIDRAYGTLLTFAAVAAVAAVITGIIWLRERDASRHRAEADRIRAYYQSRQVRAIRDAIGVFLREGDEDARKLMTQTQNFINGTGTDGNVHQFRGRG